MRGLDPRIHLLGKTIWAKLIVAKKRWTRGSSPRVTLWHKVLNQTKTASCSLIALSIQLHTIYTNITR